MKKTLFIFLLAALGGAAFAQKGRVGITPPDGGTVVRRSNDNMVSDFDPTFAVAPLRLNDVCFDRRRGAWYRWNSIAWVLFAENDNGEQAQTAYTVTNPAANILTGWDPHLYNKATFNLTTSGVDTMYIDTLIWSTAPIPGEIFVVDINTTSRTGDADTLLIHFNKIFKTYDGEYVGEWKCPPRGRVHMAFRVHVSVEGSSLVEVDDILGSYEHSGESTLAGNGLSMSADTVKLGGTLTEETTINMVTKSLTFNGQGFYGYMQGSGYSDGGVVLFNPYSPSGIGLFNLEMGPDFGNIQLEVEGNYDNNMYLNGDLDKFRMPYLEMRVEGSGGRASGFRADSLGSHIYTATGLYPIPNTRPSTTLGDSSVIVLVGNGAGGLSAVWRPKSSFGGGGGSLTGTGLTNRLAIWNGTSALGYENEFVVDSTNSRLAIGTSATAPSAQLSVRKDAIGVTQDNAYGLVLANNTAATVGAQQMSPGIRWRGNGWKTTATAASQTVDFLADVLPVQGTTSPTGTWQLKSSINGGAYSNLLNVTSAGNVGIGTTTPINLLTVYSGAADASIKMQTIQTGQNLTDGFNFSVEDATRDVYFTQRENANIRFLVNNAERLTILSTGLIGIGTNSPDRLLHPELSDATTNTVTYPMRLSKITSGTATTSFGLGTEYELENASGTNRIAATEEITYSDAVDATEDATYKLRLIKAGTLADALTITSTGGTTISSSGTFSLRTSASGNVFDVGNTGNSMLYVNTAGTSPTVGIGHSAFTFGWVSSTLFNAPSNGIMTISNNAQTDFSRLQFGGTTSSFPSLKRSGTGIVSRLADDSADAPITASNVISTATVRLKGYTVATLPAGTQGDTAFVTDALAPTYLGTIVGGGAIVTPVFFNGTNWVAH
jgi:hypothetical protein